MRRLGQWLAVVVLVALTAFLDPPEYVVPPTTLRFVAHADFARHQPDVARTFSSADPVLAVVQVWLSDIASPPDVCNATRFDADPRYARHIGQLNVLTHLIEHRDANLGNFLIGRASGLTLRYAGEPEATPLKPEPLFVAPRDGDDASVLAALLNEASLAASIGELVDEAGRSAILDRRDVLLALPAAAEAATAAGQAPTGR